MKNKILALLFLPTFALTACGNVTEYGTIIKEDEANKIIAEFFKNGNKEEFNFEFPRHSQITEIVNFESSGKYDGNDGDCYYNLTYTFKTDCDDKWDATNETESSKVWDKVKFKTSIETVSNHYTYKQDDKYYSVSNSQNAEETRKMYKVVTNTEDGDDFKHNATQYDIIEKQFANNFSLNNYYGYVRDAYQNRLFITSFYTIEQYTNIDLGSEDLTKTTLTNLKYYKKAGNIFTVLYSVKIEGKLIGDFPEHSKNIVCDYSQVVTFKDKLPWATEENMSGTVTCSEADCDIKFKGKHTCSFSYEKNTFVPPSLEGYEQY